MCCSDENLPSLSGPKTTKVYASHTSHMCLFALEQTLGDLGCMEQPVLNLLMVMAQRKSSGRLSKYMRLPVVGARPFWSSPFITLWPQLWSHQHTRVWTFSLPPVFWEEDTAVLMTTTPLLKQHVLLFTH